MAGQNVTRVKINGVKKEYPREPVSGAGKGISRRICISDCAGKGGWPVAGADEEDIRTVQYFFCDAFEWAGYSTYRQYDSADAEGVLPCSGR